MNFYRAQDQARQQTSLLLLLFALAVIVLVALTLVAVVVFIWLWQPDTFIHAYGGAAQFSALSWPDKFVAILTGLGWPKLLAIAGSILGAIAIATFFKWLNLRAGGRVVAESLGGSLVLTNTTQVDERKLLNVVEEMALASGVPVPPVYLMRSEQGINAFAAGTSLDDAVIGVSAGCMHLLTREQLQGVIAHEFSHILNGDMRLNMRIIAVLHGILVIGEAGSVLFHIGFSDDVYRSRSERRGGNFIIGLLGVGLIALGWFGQLFGALIKAAVSRQREFLADASAVQFTRNPEGIGGALRVIGGHMQGSHVSHERAHELGHLFFSQAFSSSLFATHPPLEERISAVLPNWQGDYLKPAREAAPEPVDPMQRMREQFGGGAAAAASVSAFAGAASSAPVQDATFPEASRSTSSLPNSAVQDDFCARLQMLVREPSGAFALCLALLVAKDSDIQAKQYALLEQRASAWLGKVKAAQQLTKQVGLANIVTLVERMMPALKSLSKAQYLQLRALMVEFIQADGKMVLFEWLLFELIRQHGDRHFALSKAPKAKYRKVQTLAPLFAIVASRMVTLASGKQAEQQALFTKACELAGISGVSLLPAQRCSGSKFTRACHELARAFPLIKPRLLKALQSVVDGSEQGVMAEQDVQKDRRRLDKEQLGAVLACLALIWDCPVPSQQNQTSIIEDASF